MGGVPVVAPTDNMQASDPLQPSVKGDTMPEGTPYDADAMQRAIIGNAITGDAVAAAVEPAELLDIDVDHFAGMFTPVAPDWLGRREVVHPRQAA
jgi:hypothetical protein